MSQAARFPFYGHDEGLVIEGPDTGFKQTPMTSAQLAAREPALAIAKDIYRYANLAGVCYVMLWEVIAKAMQDLVDASGVADAMRADTRARLNEIYELIFDVECRGQSHNDRLYQAKQKLIAMRAVLAPSNVDKQLVEDCRALGSAYLRIDLDGTWTRLEPERVCVRKPEDVR